MPPRLFDLIVQPQRIHPSVASLIQRASGEPTRLMMEEVFASFAIADKNFVEQFQTTGFDARVFELYLHAYFSNSGFTIERARERPDYLVTRSGITVAVEATTANPTQIPGVVPEPMLGLRFDEPVETEAELRRRLDNEFPIRLGSALFTKLQRRYWELEHVRGRPLAFAIQAFHAHDTLLFGSAGLAQYLFGLRQTGRHGDDGRLIIDTVPVATHAAGAKVIPSGFFNQPDAKHVSAVLFSNAGTVSKFTRMGFQAGLHRGNTIVTRLGTAYDPDPDAKEARPVVYRLDEDPGEEPWGSGLEVFHNPHALHPIPREFFVDAVQWYLKDEAPLTYSPPFVPVSSITQNLELDDEVFRPVEDQPGDVGTILRREFDAFDPVRPNYVGGDVPFQEVTWFADGGRRVMGTVFRWFGQERYGLVVLCPDARGRWRAVDADGDFHSRSDAAEELRRRIQRVLLEIS